MNDFVEYNKKSFCRLIAALSRDFAEALRKNATRNMANKIPTSEQLNTSAEKLSRTYFTRLMSLSDLVNRYVHVGLRGEVDWLRLGTLILIVLIGKGTMRPTELSRKLMRPTQNVTKLIDDLDKAGLITRNRETNDRRMVSVRITQDGLTYIDQSLAKINLVEEKIISVLDNDELETLARIVTKTRHTLVDLVSKKEGKDL